MKTFLGFIVTWATIRTTQLRSCPGTATFFTPTKRHSGINATTLAHWYTGTGHLIGSTLSVLRSSTPIWRQDSGQMGNKAGDITVGNTGRCVVDGAFKDIEATYYDVKLQPHCLSRGFRDDDGNLGVMDGRTISPDSIDEVLALDDYERFVKEMESRVHDTIPFGIGGDFETFTAPYNPLFFLHHTQLDRLWWLWQQRKPEERLSAYSGHNHRHPIEMASLDDKIDMRGLAPNVRVRSVMDTEGDFLCYRY